MSRRRSRIYTSDDEETEDVSNIGNNLMGRTQMDLISKEQITPTVESQSLEVLPNQNRTNNESPFCNESAVSSGLCTDVNDNISKAIKNCIKFNSLSYEKQQLFFERIRQKTMGNSNSPNETEESNTNELNEDSELSGFTFENCSIKHYNFGDIIGFKKRVENEQPTLPELKATPSKRQENSRRRKEFEKKLKESPYTSKHGSFNNFEDLEIVRTLLAAIEQRGMTNVLDEAMHDSWTKLNNNNTLLAEEYFDRTFSKQFTSRQGKTLQRRFRDRIIGSIIHNRETKWKENFDKNEWKTIFEFCKQFENDLNSRSKRSQTIVEEDE